MTGFVIGAASAASSAPIAVTATTVAEVGFFAAAGGFIAGWAFLILGVLFLLGILSEHNNSSGWAVFWMLLSSAVVLVAFNLPLTWLSIGAVAYIMIGLVWSFWRYKRHVSKMVEEYRESSAMERERILRRLHPREMLGTITAWIMVWPFSLVENLIGDIINFVQTLVTRIFRGIYFKIYESAVSALK